MENETKSPLYVNKNDCAIDIHLAFVVLCKNLLNKSIHIQYYSKKEDKNLIEHDKRFKQESGKSNFKSKIRALIKTLTYHRLLQFQTIMTFKTTTLENTTTKAKMTKRHDAAYVSVSASSKYDSTSSFVPKSTSLLTKRATMTPNKLIKIKDKDTLES